MVLIKALLSGFAGVSLCMANIRGIVTDTGTTPIIGAIVHLEKGGQMATSGADGSFTLVVNTDVLPGNNSSLLKGLSARIFGRMLNVTIVERSTVEITIFDLTGKALSTVRKFFDAGSYSITLPYRGAGIYLYNVKSGNSELVLKDNAVRGISFGSSGTSLGSSSKPQAKQSVAVINDVIAATKTGYLNYRMVVENSDASGIAIKMIASAGTVTDGDGNVYQTVMIGTQQWTVENLRTTKYIDGSVIPLITESNDWKYRTIPAYCYYNNTTNADSIIKFGALYNWPTVMDTKKLAPEGWYVPNLDDWEIMANYLALHGFNWDGTTIKSDPNKIAKSLAAKTDWNTFTDTSEGQIGNNLTKNNRSGFSALPGGYRSYNGGFTEIGGSGYWWNASLAAFDPSYAVSHYLFFNYAGCNGSGNYKSCGFSVRLVKN